jgi:hypothetical protein
MWWTKFKAYANINGFLDAIREKPNPDMRTSWFDEINLTTETGKKQWQWQASQWLSQEKGLCFWLVR